MANIKAVYIEAEVPFTWMLGDGDCMGDTEGGMKDEDAAWLARTFLSPVYGLRLENHEQLRYEDNSWGGRTAWYRITITGEEAISWPALDRLRELIAERGKVTVWDAEDIQDRLGAVHG
jgi:hypothetical protein